MPLDLRKLYHATILANERNFTKAADRLCITQPALSRSVTKLETEVGFPIFDRNPGEITLTALGKTFMARAQVLLEYSHDLSHDIALLREGLSGTVAFGMTAYPATVLLSKLSDLALHDREGLKFRVEVASRERLLGQLDEEEIDFFIAGSNRFALGAQYSVTPLFEMSLSMFVRKNHPLSSRKIHTSTELLKFPFIGPIVAPRFLISFKYALKLPARSSFQLTVSCDDINALKTMAVSSDAILIAPHLALSAEIENRELCELRLTGSLQNLTKGRSEVSIIQFSDKVLSPATETLVQQLIGLSREINIEQSASPP